MKALDRTKVPTPKHRAWAVAHGTPWEVSFPRRGVVPGKRRFFSTEQDANEAITEWLRGDTSTGLSKRLVDEVLYIRSMLPKGTSLTDLWRFYAQHHTGLIVATVKKVADAYLVDLKRSPSKKYREEQERVIEQAVEFFGAETLFSALPKARLIEFIKEPGSYWNRYGRKRVVRCLISKARELDAIKVDPLDGWKFEKAPKSTPHTLHFEEVQKIMEHVLATRPEFVPCFALQLFAGIRSEELCRPDEKGKRALRWEDITFGQSIDVPIEVSKTNDRRVISFWPAALTHWLNAVKVERKGRVCVIQEYTDAKSDLIEEVEGVNFQQNDFRRTYASNAYALHGALVQDWMGHTDGRMLKKHYRDFVPVEKAKVFFESKPAAQHQNVIALTA